MQKQQIITHDSGLRVSEIERPLINVNNLSLESVVGALKGSGGVGEAKIRVERDAVELVFNWDERKVR